MRPALVVAVLIGVAGCDGGGLVPDAGDSGALDGVSADTTPADTHSFDTHSFDVSSSDTSRDGNPPDTSDAHDSGPMSDSSSVCAISTFIDGFTPLRRVYVSPFGSDSNDGLDPSRAWRSLANSRNLQPGDEVRIAAGRYACGVYVENLRGTATNPIVFRSVDGPRAAIFDCGGATGPGGISYVSSQYLAFDGLEVGNARGHVLHFHSNSDWLTFRSNHILVINSYIHDSVDFSPIKVSQSTHIDIIGNEIGWTAPAGAVSGQGVDFVAVDSSRIMRNFFHDVRGNVTIQAKGGSTDVLIEDNVIRDTDIGVQLGQSTGPQFFVPATADYEGLRILAIGNVIYGRTRVGLSAQGCHDCLIANNTLALVDSGQPLRSLTGGAAMGASTTLSNTRNLRVVNNLLYLTGGSPGALLNMTPENIAGLLQSHNLFYFSGGMISRIYSDTPVDLSMGTIVDRDPVLVDPANGDVGLRAGSPAIDAGVPVAEVIRAHGGTCRTSWNIGAR